MQRAGARKCQYTKKKDEHFGGLEPKPCVPSGQLPLWQPQLRNDGVFFFCCSRPSTEKGKSGGCRRYRVQLAAQLAAQLAVASPYQHNIRSHSLADSCNTAQVSTDSAELTAGYEMKSHWMRSRLQIRFCSLPDHIHRR